VDDDNIGLVTNAWLDLQKRRRAEDETENPNPQQEDESKKADEAKDLKSIKKKEKLLSLKNNRRTTRSHT
jgi:hypothetical protein